ncbi:MAG: response regulator [Deltaproteobacteria bacterium]|nr:response regulator [Deltaproteobacteria bacterium]
MKRHSHATRGLLVCQHEIVSRERVARAFTARGWLVVATGRVDEAMQSLGRGFEAVLVDLGVPGLDAESFLREARASGPEVDVILVAADATIEAAISLLNQGAADFLVRPVRVDELELRLRRLGELREQRAEIERLRAILGYPAADPRDGVEHPSPTGLFSLHLDGQPRVEMLELVRRFQDEVVEWALRRANGEHGVAAHLLGVPVTELDRLRARS